MNDDVNGFVTRFMHAWRLGNTAISGRGSCLAILLEIPRFMFNFPG